MNALMSQIEILSWVKTSICGPLGAKDQKPTSQNKVPPVMHLGLQDGSDTEGEREESESEPERTSILLSGFCISRRSVSVTEFYFEGEEVGGLQVLATRQCCVAWTV
jgi:hypothetical protein